MHEEPQRFKAYVENRERRSARPWHLVGRNRMSKIITKYIDEPKTQVTSGHWQSRNAAGTECVHGKYSWSTCVKKWQTWPAFGQHISSKTSVQLHLFCSPGTALGKSEDPTKNIEKGRRKQIRKVMKLLLWKCIKRDQKARAQCVSPSMGRGPRTWLTQKSATL